MNLTNTIVNLRNLKDEALRFKEDMDYPATLQIVAFCDRAIREFSKVDDKYGPAFSVYTSAEETAASALTLHDIATADQQEKLMEKLARNVELYSMTFHPQITKREETQGIPEPTDIQKIKVWNEIVRRTADPDYIEANCIYPDGPEVNGKADSYGVVCYDGDGVLRVPCKTLDDAFDLIKTRAMSNDRYQAAMQEMESALQKEKDAALAKIQKPSNGLATPEQFAEDKKRISAFLGKEDWPAHLFTNAEISVMVERLEKGADGERDVLDKINGAISKDFVQKLKIQQMNKNKPVEKICESVMNLNVLGKNNNAEFNKWILDEYKSIYQTFGSRDSMFPSVFLLDNIERRCAEAAQPKNVTVSMGINDDDRQAVSRFASYVSGSFDKAMEQRRNMQELTNGKYESFTRPIVKFLRATGMDEEKILNVFDGMKRTAEKLLGKSQSAVR